MQLSVLSNFINVLGAALALLLLAVFGARYPSAFFRPWTIGFGLFFGYLIVVMVSALTGGGLTPALLQVSLLAGASWYTGQTARVLRGKPPFDWREGAGLAVLAAISIGTLLMGVPYRFAMCAATLGYMAVLFRLGLVFLRQLPADAAAPGAAWVAWPTIIQALWPLLYPFPLLADTSYAWIGWMVSGLLNMAMGIGMTVYLVDVSWQRQLRAQEQVVALRNDFVSIVSHELRAPLTSVMGYAEFLEDGVAGDLNDEQASYVHEIQRGAQRLKRLVDDLLDISLAERKALTLTCRDADLGASVRAVVESMRPQALQAEVAMEARLPEAPLVVRMDADRLEQVATNLIGNAIKFTPPGGRVEVILTSDQEGVKLAVRDTGVGVAPEDLPHLFDKFFQVRSGSRRARGGAGLGLSISRAIVEGHGGIIGVESEPDRGTCFYLCLPAQGLAEVVLAEETA